MKIWLKIVIGLTSGLLCGLVFGEKTVYISVVGELFISLLKMLVPILIFSCIVTGVCHIQDPRKLGRIGAKTVLFYLSTTLIAVLMAVVIGVIVKPGMGLNLSYDASQVSMGSLTEIKDFILSLVPANPIKAFADGNILQVILFAILFAYAIMMAGEKANGVIIFFESIAEVMNELTHLVMRFAPIGVFALIATSIGSIGVKVVLPLAILLLCNYLALFVQVFVIFTSILKFSGMSIMPFFKGMKDAIVLAFTTSSSSATLPVTMECAREELGISDDISGFVLSLGSTVNMNGTAVGQVLASMFIAQAYGIELTVFMMIMITLTSLFSAIGAAGIPGTGIVMLSVVLKAAGLPLEGIGLVIGIDRLREMFSCVVNVLGDAVGAVYIAKQEGAINERKFESATWV